METGSQGARNGRMAGVRAFFSVIVPTYNRSFETSRALLSVAKQTKPADYSGIFLDCWVIDDGSDPAYDPSEGLREEFGRRKILLHHKKMQKNLGVAKARNQGIFLSSGHWVAFLDSDDEWHRDKLLEQYRYIIANPVYKVIQTEEIWIRKGRRVNPAKVHEKKVGNLFQLSLSRCLITPSSVVLKRELIEGRKYYFDEGFPACEDYELWLRVSLRERIGLIRKKLLIRYGGHGDQLSFRYPIMDRFRLKALMKIKRITSREKREKGEKNFLFEEKWVDAVFYKKINIVLQGAWKRKRFLFYAYYWCLKHIYKHVYKFT